ncbi:hypothetical protein ACIBI0_15410 [Microbispora rosea]|uniref:hypothetical protein n=1 Tax=Microbispora rosea TaxID=58117 RepID=UPI0037A47D12
MPRSLPGGDSSGSPNTTAAMSPRSPRTYGTAWSGGWNPVRAQVGSGAGDNRSGHPPDG